MKKYYLIALIFLSAISQAQIVNIPDANFKDSLLNYSPIIDTNGDGEIQVVEAEAITILYVSGRNISSLVGIESFTNLIFLDCDSNNLTNLDLSQNINLSSIVCYNNQLTNLNFSNDNLVSLDCAYNNLTNLDLSNSNVFWVSCEYNDLTQINTDGALNLNILSCAQNNITSLNLSSNPNLDLIVCWENQLTELDLSQNSILTRISCRDNNLSSLSINNGNNENLDYMWAFNNPNLACIKVDDVAFSNSQVCNQVGFTGWCKDSIAVYSEDCILKISDITKANYITIYPNPTQDILNIESPEQIDSVQIYSINGILVKQGINTRLRVSELPTGVYFVRILINNKTLTKKVVKS